MNTVNCMRKIREIIPIVIILGTINSDMLIAVKKMLITSILMNFIDLKDENENCLLVL